MPDLGLLSTEYQRASQTAFVLEEAADGLQAAPHRLPQETGQNVGLYLISMAGLIDPQHAERIDADLASRVPRTIVLHLGKLNDEDPGFASRLVAIGDSLRKGKKLDARSRALVQRVADAAATDAAALSREILRD